MVDLSIKRFREKGELSEFEKYPATTDIFKNIIKYGKSKYQIKMFSVYIKNKLAAADLIAIHNNVYYPLQGGSYNVHDYPGIGNYMDLLEIDDAITLGIEKMDFLQIDYGWKHRKFTEIPMFKYEA
jgi:transcription-repair coupling factor (superfamily II helicase)